MRRSRAARGRSFGSVPPDPPGGRAARQPFWSTRTRSSEPGAPSGLDCRSRAGRARPLRRRAARVHTAAACGLTASEMTGRNAESELAERREQMVEEQLLGRDIRDPRVLEAMARVPRELFVPPELRERAYDDAALPIGSGQTISQPYVVARIAELMAL